MAPVRHRNSTITARTLRASQTNAEKEMWHQLKAKRFHGYKFKRQYPIGPYIADFVCLEAKLVIEVDGGQHCESKKDNMRTGYLKKEGFEVVRFWNKEVLGNMEGVLSSLSLTLSRCTGEGTMRKDI